MDKKVPNCLHSAFYSQIFLVCSTAIFRSLAESDKYNTLTIFLLGQMSLTVPVTVN